MWKALAIAAAVLGLAACGETTLEYPDDVVTQAPPYVNRVDPAEGPAGTAISIYGFGFSVAAGNNIVLIGNGAVVAESYELLPTPSDVEIERITTTVPEDTAAGSQAVVVMVHERPSNADKLFTVLP